MDNECIQVVIGKRCAMDPVGGNFARNITLATMCKIPLQPF